MRGRAFRRHQFARTKRRVQGHYGGYAQGDPRHTGKLARTRTPCSCWMCGNPRHSIREPAVQERRAGGRGNASKVSCLRLTWVLRTQLKAWPAVCRLQRFR